MIWKLLLFVAFTVLIFFTFLTYAPQQVIGESSRIFYYHIPQAWLCVIAYAMSMIYSILYLKKRDIKYDDKAVTTAQLGFIFCVLATVTGAIFAESYWGKYWNWDPRQTSIFILLLIYGAYFALRGAIEVEEKKATLSAVYSIFAFITVPFLVFILPRLVDSLHPSVSIIDENMRFTMGKTVSMMFFPSLILFTTLFIWMFNLGDRVNVIKRKTMDDED